jgi:hypothetical protein
LFGILADIRIHLVNQIPVSENSKQCQNINFAIKWSYVDHTPEENGDLFHYLFLVFDDPISFYMKRFYAKNPRNQSHARVDICFSQIIKLVDENCVQENPLRRVDPIENGKVWARKILEQLKFFSLNVDVEIDILFQAVVEIFRGENIRVVEEIGTFYFEKWDREAQPRVSLSCDRSKNLILLKLVQNFASHYKF